MCAPNERFFNEALEGSYDPPYAYGYFDAYVGYDIHKRPKAGSSAIYWCKDKDNKYQLRLWVTRYTDVLTDKQKKSISNFSCSALILNNREVSTGVRVYVDDVDQSEYMPLSVFMNENENSDYMLEKKIIRMLIIHLSLGIDQELICLNNEWYIKIID